MRGLRDVLSRFRAAGAPGAPGAAGMPVDPRAGVTAELEPVFTALAATTAECARVRAAGTAQAQRLLEEARERAAAMVTQASDAAQAARATETARMRERTDTDVAAVEAASRAAAEEIARHSAERLPVLVNAVVEQVRRDIATIGADASARGGSLP